MKMTTPLLRVIHLSISARVIKPLCFSATSDMLSNNERFLSNNGITLYYLDFFFPTTTFSIAPPILRSKPCLVVGIPTLRAILVFKPLMPNALLRENDNPGIFIMLYTILLDNRLLPLIFWAATLFAVLIERGECHIIVTTRGIDTSTLWSIIANLSVESKYCIKLLLE